MRLICPHCGCHANTRTSTKMSPLTGHAYYACSNVDCGHTFKAAFEIVGTISPSAMPNPAIVLPTCKGVGKNCKTMSKSVPLKEPA